MAPDRGLATSRQVVLGAVMAAGGVLAGVSAALPPAAVESETLVLVLGALALAIGVAMMLTRWRAPVGLLAAATALGTVLITLSTWAGGSGTGTGDNEILYIWISLYSFYYLGVQIGLFQLGFVALSYAWLLQAQSVPVAEATNRFMITLSTLLVVGLVVARLRRSLEGTVAQLSERARFDSLTGLLNRHELEERAAIELARRRRNKTELSMIAIDLDEFKALNDSLGHPAGDDVLRRVGEVLDQETRQIDVVARAGGDEFVVLLPATGLAEARMVAERLLNRLRSPDDQAVPEVTVSIGVAVTSPGPITLDELWAAGDAALYGAKRAGGDRVSVAGPSPLALAVQA